ncbi:MAG: YybH family protein [Gammaproteobacteria bacterium]
MKGVGIFALAVMLLLAGCQGGGAAADAGARAAVKSADNAFSMLSVKAGFASAFRKYALEQAVFLPDGRAPLTSRETIEQSLATLPPGTHLSWSAQGADASGSVGYTWGIYTLTGKNSTGQPTVAYGKYLSVWEKQSGRWELAAMMLNRSPGPMG